MTEEMYSANGPRLSRDAHLELMVYHLQMAHAHFESCPPDRAENREEVERLFLVGKHTVKVWKDDGGLGKSEEVVGYPDSPEIVAGLVWLDRMEDIYAEMAKDD